MINIIGIFVRILRDLYFSPHFLFEYYYTSNRLRHHSIADENYAKSSYIRLMSTLIFSLPLAWALSLRIMLSENIIYNRSESSLITLAISILLWKLDYSFMYSWGNTLKAREKFITYNKSRIIFYTILWGALAGTNLYLSLRTNT